MTCHHAPIGAHQPIPEDEAHCWCQHDDESGFVNRARARECPWSCPCHAPAWLDDADVPDFFPGELEEPS